MQMNDVPGGFIEAVFPNGLWQRSQLILCKQSQIEPNQNCNTRKNRGTIDVQKKRDPGSVFFITEQDSSDAEKCAAMEIRVCRERRCARVHRNTPKRLKRPAFAPIVTSYIHELRKRFRHEQLQRHRGAVQQIVLFATQPAAFRARRHQ